MSSSRKKTRKKASKREPVVLVVDIGGSKIKLRKSDSPHTLKFESGQLAACYHQSFSP